MSAVWGNNLRLTVFGESHGNGIGGVIDGLPAGITLDMERILFQMSRRAPGQGKATTARKESDVPEFLSGVFEEHTTGAPLAFLIRNQNTHSGDYNDLRTKMRPSHADYPAWVKFHGQNDYRGGGAFSGRITAPLVFAGAVCEQVLEKEGIYVASYITRLGGIDCGRWQDETFSKETANALKKELFPILDLSKISAVEARIEEVRQDGNSVGGVIECRIEGVPAGLGNPFFDSFESMLSHLLFSVPAVKGVEFGAGFSISDMTGKDANDAMGMSGDKVVAFTNNNGGICGGITNGMPIVFRTAIKPTPSIAMEQKTVDVSKMENTTLCIHGRHDPVIVPRAIPVIEACAMLCTMDAWLEAKK